MSNHHPMQRAREIVEAHVATHGPVPSMFNLIDVIATELALFQLSAVKPSKPCDCGAVTEGKWADKHSPNCAALRAES